MKRKISIVIPAYNEAESLRELFRQVRASVELCVQRELADDYEIILIDDGSTDGTADTVKALMVNDSHILLICFRKNFGKSPALNSGFHHLSGDVVFTMDADLQDDPAEMPRFLEKLDEGYDMVVGWKKDRQDPAEKRIPSKFFNKVTTILSGLELHDFDCGYKCFRRETADSLEIYGELHRYVPVLALRNGFRITEIPVQHHKREYGSSKYGMERYMRGALDSLTTVFLLKYSDRPMYLFGRIGVYIGLIGFLICLYMTFMRVQGEGIGGRPLLVLGVLLLIVGIQFISTGFLGNLLVDSMKRNSYTEYHIKEITCNKHDTEYSTDKHK